MAIPVKLTEKQFQTFVEPHLSRAKRGYACKISRFKLFNYVLHVLYTGCQWPALQASIDRDETGEPELSFQAVYYHFRKWSRDGSLPRVFDSSVRTLLPDLDVSELNLDGTHTLAKKGANRSPIKAVKRAKPATFYRSRTNRASS
jgi:transposase